MQFEVDPSAPSPTHLGNVDETVLVNAYVHKGPEGGDIGYDSRDFHPLDQVVDGMDILRE